MSLGPWEIALIVLVIFLLFGATRLPNAARSLGRSMRIFKSEMDEMKQDGNRGQADAAQPAQIAQQPAAGETPEQSMQRLQAQQQAQPQAQPQAQQPRIDNGQN
ncbi:Sec-independent protein translocase subunit TatA [Corynebacterium heidelbergense]|uniref:Sec-independent protein translocase protein TatA n=1 Tax=Corynebacterium heidelbergense TaxID=2055947 RepID=A0A364V4C6_9CORY|nr:Sec-independent protein translocase subunit TatA [Corynebacterium heidelbergense]RAV31495.1 twin-arginine translocase TatA/TatE family subunit [Corynebacterium heidelbergense]